MSDSYTPPPPHLRCPRCHGSRVAYRHWIDRRGRDRYDPTDCHVCGGSGRRPEGYDPERFDQVI